MEFQIGTIGNTIQLAIAPVFLLAGVGTKLAVLTNRLARIIDRTRVLEARVDAVPEAPHAAEYRELDSLYRRANLINLAITLSTACGLLVCVVIAALFIGAALGIKLGMFIAVCFVGGMFSLIGSFCSLLREIFVAMQIMSERRLARRR